MVLTTSTNHVIEVQDLDSGYGSEILNEKLNFQVRAGEIFGILGGSGCGKTTLLKNMIGLLPPIRGCIRIQGQDMVAASGALRDRMRRSFGVAYQSGALFGSMSLLQNICLPLKEHTNLKPQARERVAATKLRMVGLGGFENYPPEEISGGMRKRAAIARAMALDPKIIFLDEPSAGLDPVTAADLDALLVNLARTLDSTLVIVTHELHSIFAIIDRAIVLDRQARGIIAEGSPKELRDQSTDPRVRGFFQRRTTSQMRT